MVATDHAVAAEEQLLLARERLANLDGSADSATPALRARLEWAHGVLQQRRGNPGQARDALVEASRIFSQLGDGRSRAAVMRIIEGIHNPAA